MMLLAVVLAMPCQPSISFEGGEKTHRIQVRVAQTPKQREQGLMHVESLAIDRGMWFVFPREATRRFWMKNTLIPLDIIFVNGRLEVINIVHRAEPGTLTARRSTAPAQYVLELAGGQAKARGLKPGTRLQPCGLPAL
ncbi:MAG: hypothetical protein CMH55_01990 [Myxococcales bacterium]|nr:hypothetical protein [Myxococcales bacterium]|tara:strand:+ start:230 stop:643 length:414 start_codon:yes stop_codon:yes gene_type:complete